MLKYRCFAATLAFDNRWYWFDVKGAAVEVGVLRAHLPTVKKRFGNDLAEVSNDEVHLVDGTISSVFVNGVDNCTAK